MKLDLGRRTDAKVLTLYGLLAACTGMLLGWTAADGGPWYWVAACGATAGFNVALCMVLLDLPKRTDTKATVVSDDEAHWRRCLEGKT